MKKLMLSHQYFLGFQVDASFVVENAAYMACKVKEIGMLLPRADTSAPVMFMVETTMNTACPSVPTCR